MPAEAFYHDEARYLIYLQLGRERDARAFIDDALELAPSSNVLLPIRSQLGLRAAHMPLGIN